VLERNAAAVLASLVTDIEVMGMRGLLPRNALACSCITSTRCSTTCSCSSGRWTIRKYSVSR
jgi:hypothetical protein